MHAFVRSSHPSERLIWALPKVDLHCHLDGSLRLATILELAEAQGVKLPAEDEEGLARAMRAGERCKDLVEYLSAFEVTLSVLQDRHGLYRAAYELALDVAAENGRYLEVRFCPGLHLKKGLAAADALEAVMEGLSAARAHASIRTGVIVCALRHLNPKDSVEMAELAVAYEGKGVVGFDLAGAEQNHPAREHLAAFRRAREGGLCCTAHAGEADGAGSIAQAVRELGVERIGHGTRLWEDPELMDEVRERRIALEVCLSSNVQTGVTARVARHPAKLYLERGVRVTFNTDNRLISRTTLTEELLAAHLELGLTAEEVAGALMCGFKSAFLPQSEKQALLTEVSAEISRVFEEFGVQKQPASAG